MAKPTIWDKQIRVATWKQSDAVRLANKLLPFVGQQVVLYGGGGKYKGLGRLTDVKVEIPKYYRTTTGQERVHYPKGIFTVRATLTRLDPPVMNRSHMGTDSVTPMRTFRPSLGSWRIAPIINGKAVAIT